ncbi:MAG: bifunctional hydroxymethylpyrimidine kinase/phosphomethylpyrimidine kinase [Anaerolineales bacterium]|nr:bifunctional hydroxymethylpyrimidine kinase/phosphomethylpyrimidine kinase [Anaerolineales bacterium]MCB8950693.1 bifunctional hydroxymethylpyrimidine kinase/phosphomethylpyrimidine kinase [Ardenticatenales bacterium]
MSSSYPLRLLTIGGSDSGGAAGIQADLKTFTALHAYGMSALTVVTAQDSERIAAAHFLPPALVAAQIESVLGDYGADAIKTGFIGQADLVQTIAAALAPYAHIPLLVDPVLVNHRGEAMFPAAVTLAYEMALFPRAALITPNRREAELLSGMAVRHVAEGVAALQHLRAAHPRPWLLKSIPDGPHLVDILHDGQITLFRAPRQTTANTHGSGDTLSAAIINYLAQGQPLPQAIAAAHAFTQQAIRAAAPWRLTRGHGPLLHWSD